MTPSKSNVTSCLKLLRHSFPAMVGNISTSAASQSKPSYLKLFPRARHLLPADPMFVFVYVSETEVFVNLTQRHMISAYDRVEHRLCGE